MLALGDNQYPYGGLLDYRAFYQRTWGRFKDLTRPVPGNHEYAGGRASGYLAYFGSAARPHGRTWYSYDLGGWHLVALDSNLARGAGSEQVRWLRQDLAATRQRCILAYWHHPRFSSGAGHGSDPSQGAFWNALYAAGADLVLNGHEHNYERFAPQDPAGRADPDRGVREFVAGTGGADLYDDFLFPVANSQVRNARTHGVLELTLRPAGYAWRFVSVDGSVVDAGGPWPCH